MLKLSPKAKWNLSRVLPFGIIWLITGWIFLLVESLATGGVNPDPRTAISITPGVFLFSSIAVLFVGLLIGAIEMIFIEKLFKTKSFLTKTFYKLDLYICILLVIICITFPIAAALESGQSVFHPDVWDKFRRFLFSLTFLTTLIQMAFSLLLCLIYAGISENLGHAVLVNFFTGKYHQPMEEERIFMFLDMKSSTTFAEQLGHIQYFELLQNYYADLSDAIIVNSGEVYQYVGDEVVISWPVSKGLENNKCLRCFYKMKSDLQNRNDFYNKRFGLFPAFKAGVHLGYVTTGEIGALKKEIIFSGDVLNVSSRIQGLCNIYEADLLISRDLKNKLHSTSEFIFSGVGSAALNGRKEKMELYAVQPSPPSK